MSLYVSGQLAPPLSCRRLCLWQVSKLTDGTKLWGAVASGSFVGRLTTGRVDDATRKMTWPSKGGYKGYTGLPEELLDFNLNFNRMPNRQT